MVIGCLRLSDVSYVICRVTYLQFPIQVCFSTTSVSQPTQPRTCFNQYRTSDVAENLGRFLVRSVEARDDFELILTVKMETRNPVELSVGSEFP